jgi:ankyrin repeat protein
MQLIDAAKRGDLVAIRRILSQDANAIRTRADTGETPLMAALYRGQSEAVTLLLDSGAPLDLFAASAVGSTDALVRELERPGVSVGDYAYDGWTALHLAAFFGRHNAAERLIDAGADPQAPSRNSMANTPLHAALAGRHTEVALLLIARGADVNATDAGRHTPLHIATENGLIDAVRALISAGADPHAVDADDNTPLSRAAAKNRSDIVDALNDLPSAAHEDTKARIHKD